MGRWVYEVLYHDDGNMGLRVRVLVRRMVMEAARVGGSQKLVTCPSQPLRRGSV